MDVDHAQTIEQRSSTPLTVLHATQPTGHGVALAALSLVADQVARGWTVIVASPLRDAFVAEVEARGGKHQAWAAGRAPGPSSSAEIVRLAGIVRGTDPDIVHLHSSKAGLAGRLAVRGRRPTIFQPHAWSFEAVGGIQRHGAVLWERFGVRWTDVIVCVSERERLRGEEMGIRAPMRVIPNGIDLDAFAAASPHERVAARAHLGLPAGPLVVCVGRLSRQKGQDLLLAAWPAVCARVPDATLVLVGDGPERGRLQRNAPPDVVFTGTRFDVPDWLAAADVVAVPSRWEGMSLALLEALARGRSVVATDAVGSAEVIGDTGGAIVPVEDVEALAAALVERLLEPARADAEGREGRARMERDHDVRRATAEVAALYSELAALRAS